MVISNQAAGAAHSVATLSLLALAAGQPPGAIQSAITSDKANDAAGCATSALYRDSSEPPAYSDAPGVCPFRRPWETCALDDTNWAAKLAHRRYGAFLCNERSFDASRLLYTLARRTLLFIGDSLSLQFFVSLACQIHAQTPQSVTHHKLDWARVPLLRKRCHNERRCHYQYGCIHFKGGSRICHCFIWELGRRGLQSCMRKFNVSHVDPIVYGSIGVHYRENSRFYTKGTTPLAKQEADTVLDILKPQTRLIWREVTAQHFAFPGGHFNFPSMADYNKWRPNATCSPDHTLAEMQRHHKWNNISVPLMEQAGVPVLRVWLPSSLAYDAHIGHGDCTHFCMPGALDHWTIALQIALEKQAVVATATMPGALQATDSTARTMGTATTPTASSAAAAPALATNVVAQDRWLAAKCPLKVPQSLTLPPHRSRPPDILPWTAANVTASGQQKASSTAMLLKFTPNETRADWTDAIWASQHPAACQRFLLVEDDMLGSGFGLDVKLLGVALLLAMKQRRVLLHVPGKDRIYSHYPPNVSNIGRWCDRPPYTYDCLWEPLSHCDPPPPGIHEEVPTMRYP